MEKISKTERHNTIIKMAKDPVRYLIANKDKGCAEAILFLRQVRLEIRSDNTIIVRNPDPDFKKFTMNPDNTVEHYVSLCNMLKQAGYDKIVVLEASMDLLPNSGYEMNRSEAVKIYLRLINEAVEAVYGQNQ